jgi:hypothetical protein
LAAKVRGLLRREDDYRSPGKPAGDWTDRAAREELVDALVRDAYRAHVGLRGERLVDALVRDAYRAHVGLRGERLEERWPRRQRCWPP